MNFWKKWFYFWSNLREKHRLSIRNQHTNRELWYMHLSPLNLLSGFLALVLVLFLVITLTVAYTPLLDFIPGYPGNKSRTMLIQGIIRLDSLQQELDNMQIYTENVALIMAGKSPVTRYQPQGDSLTGSSAEVVSRIEEDSTLRAQMESSQGVYSLNDPTNTRKNLRTSMELFAPVEGVVISTFNSIKGRYCVQLSTTENQQVLAVLDGTVIASNWTPQEGYVLYIQHSDNLISIYRNNVSALKKRGERVQGGEVIAYTGASARSSKELAQPFEFELWHNAVAVDPQNYILF